MRAAILDTPGEARIGPRARRRRLPPARLTSISPLTLSKVREVFSKGSKLATMTCCRTASSSAQTRTFRSRHFPVPQPVSASAALQRSRRRRSAHRATARTSLLSAPCAAASVTRPVIGCFTLLAALPGPMISSPSPKPPRERASHRSCGGLAGQPEPASKCRSRHIGQRIWNICTPITAPQASDLSAGRSGSIPISRCRSCAPG